MGVDRVQGDFQSKKLNNHKLSLGASEEVTYFVNQSGSDSASSPYKIYYNFERDTIAINIRATVACSLTEMNGRALKSPLSLNPGSNLINIWATSFKIVSTASTVLEVTIR